MSIRGVLRTIVVSLAFLGLLIPTSEVLAKGGGRGSSSGYYHYRGAKAIDGDTFRYGQTRYRVQGYNAPEIGQPGSRRATKALQKQLDSGSYSWKPVARDVYGRKIVKPHGARK